MVKLLFNFIFPVLLLCSCDQEDKTEPPGEAQAVQQPIVTEATPAYGFIIFLSDSTKPDLGFGYNIISDGRIFIHQPTIPSLPGNKGFSIQSQAEKTAEFIIYKLKHHIMPPSVTPEELDSLGVLTKI